MKFSIKNLGPLKKAELDLGDITMLLGPPNSGKSYTLRSFYTKLIMLDEIARDYIVRAAVDEIEILEHIEYFSRVVAPAVLITIAALHKFFQSRNFEKTLVFLKEKLGIEKVDVKIEKDKIIVNLQNDETMDLAVLANLLNDRLVSTSQELVPWEDSTMVDVYGEASVPKMLSLLHEMFETSFEMDKRIIEREGISAFLNVVFSLEDEDTLKVSTDLQMNLELNSKIYKLLQREYERISGRLESEGLEREDVSLFVNKVSRLRLLPSEWRVRAVFRDLSELVSEIKNHFASNIGWRLKSIYTEVFNLQSIVFIPFGRSPFVYQLDTISDEPYLWDDLMGFYENNLTFYSYMHDLSRGRKQVVSGKAEKDLIKMFAPVLQGDLVFDNTTRKLRYRRWNTIDVPINYASALAGEITGIMLPILSMPSESYLIIEEPEAQLHYSAQILMALVLVGLSKRFDHKVILSTHSDVFAITMAYLKELDYDETKISELIRKLLEFQGIKVGNEEIMPLAEAVSQKKDLDIKFHYYEPHQNGTVDVSKMSAKEILKDVPGITAITDILASWALSL